MYHNDTGHPSSTAFVAPSGTSYTNRNPEYRVYSVVAEQVKYRVQGVGCIKKSLFETYYFNESLSHHLATLLTMRPGPLTSQSPQQRRTHHHGKCYTQQGESVIGQYESHDQLQSSDWGCRQKKSLKETLSLSPEIG